MTSDRDEVLPHLPRVEAINLLRIRVRSGSDAVLPEESDVRDHERDERKREEPDVERVKAGEREAPELGPALDDLLHPRADPRHRPGDVHLHSPRPVPFLVPGQEVSGDGEAERQPEEREPEEPVHLARALVCAEDRDLDEVRPEQHDHRIRAEVMQPTDDPAGGEAVRDVVDAGPGGGGARRVRGHEEEPRDDLKRKEDGERAPEDVRPARPADHRLVEQLANEVAVADPLLQPRFGAREGAGARTLFRHGHPIASRSAAPMRNFWKSTATNPRSTLVASGSIPRGVGPPVLAPSEAKVESWHGQVKEPSGRASIEQPR